jgi:short-subunit dehydrogenase
MANDLSTKVIILTGASDGIGREIAYQLGKEHATIVLAARRRERLEEVARAIEASGGRALVVPTDLREQAQIANLARTTLDAYGRVDVLINVAGMSYYDFLEELTADEVREQYEINIIAMVELMRQVVPGMKAQGSGHIVNFTSIASRIAFPPLSLYASTKYAIEGISDGLRRELSPWNIKVTRVHPASVYTAFNDKAARHGGIYYPHNKLTGVTTEKVAAMVVKVLKHPRIAIYPTRLGPLVELAVLINRHLPFVVDWVMKPRVQKMWRTHKEHDLAPDLVALHQRKV